MSGVFHQIANFLTNYFDALADNEIKNTSQIDHFDLERIFFRKAVPRKLKQLSVEAFQIL